MKALPPTHLGSWSRGVTTCDGRWQIRCHFSQTCTFVIKNYLTGCLLYYGHLSMRGADTICIKSYRRVHQRLQRDIWHRFCGQKQKKKGSMLRLIGRMPTHHQQRDFVMHIQMSKSRGSCCVGHVGRTHGKKLLDLQTRSSFSRAFIDRHKKDHPHMDKLKCCCSGKKHTYVATRNKPACGCISPAFIQSAKRNHYCALVQAGQDVSFMLCAMK